MGITTVTITEGANATVPDGTSFPALQSSSGPIPLVVPGYAPDVSTAPTPLADENGIFIQGTAEITGDNSSTVTKGTVSDTTTSATIIAANPDRTGFSIVNTSSARMYLAMGGTASATNLFIALSQWQECSMYGSGVWVGDITGVWASDPGDGVAAYNEMEE